ncbi:hypothetical protein D9611_007395 [Ephemerocybe angulata]|uniref:NAD(P)-binding protein n=1 Tax=Ephemerocybe angulata TaxID=980116 RepID=A0A8H5CFE4_9AGAR|nr:hypothetical protein D9611_007395 [Tulosesus angulatus]
MRGAGLDAQQAQGLPSRLPGHVPFSAGQLFNVEGLVAVITGGGTGIGLMMAKTLESNGATVYIIGRRKGMLEKAAKDHARFGNIIPLEGDITSRDALLSIVETIRTRHGYIDLLVNNAAIATNLYPHPLPGPLPSPDTTPPSIKPFQTALWDCGSPQDFADTFSTNVTAIYYTTVAFLDLLHQGNARRRKAELNPQSPAGGLPLPYQTSQVLTVSSSGGFRIDAKVLSPSYTLSKAACTHLGKLLANLLAPWAIRSNVLAPGVFPTGGGTYNAIAAAEMTMATAPGVKLDPAVLAANVPVKRTGTEEDMAGTILFLASRAGAYVNGAVWLVDGGRVSTISTTL